MMIIRIDTHGASGSGNALLGFLQADRGASTPYEGGIGMGPTVPLRVLVVGSDVPARSSLTAQLERLGHAAIAQAEDGRQALYLTEQLRPDLVLIDTDPAPLDCIDACQRIGQTALAPIILIGTSTDPSQLCQAGRAPVHAYLTKPVSEYLLSPAIEIAVERFRESQQLRQQLDSVTEILDTCIVLKRATAHLANRFGFAPADAWKWIEQEARARRASLPDVAIAVLEGTAVPYRYNVPV
jgi:two-component system, response regulator PdtaR